MSWEPIINGWLLAALTALGIAIVIVTGRASQEFVPPRRHRLLTLLRVAAVIGVALLAGQPFWIRLLPDPEAIEVVVLADLSGSMDVRDLPGSASRSSAVEALLDQSKDSLATRLAQRHPLRFFSYRSERQTLLPGTPFPVPAGMTATGDALRQTLVQRNASGRSLAGVVLLSDGQETTGETRMIDAGRQLRDAGIPVTTIGIGTPGEPRDFSITFNQNRLPAQAHQPIQLQTTARNRLGRDVIVGVELLAGSTPIDLKNIAVPANSDLKLDFDVPPMPSGFHSYRIRLTETLEGTNPATDQDYATVEVAPPERFRILYLGEKLHPEFRFLRQVADDVAPIALYGLVRTAEETFNWTQPTTQGDTEAIEPRDTFPGDGAFFLQFDAVIFDPASAHRMNESTWAGLRGLVSNRGGGLLVVGAVPPEVEELTGMLPIRSTDAVQVREDRQLDLEADPVFSEGPRGTLFQRPSVFLPAGMPAFRGEAKRGAVPLAVAANSGDLFAAVQAYGGGRVAWLGTADTWRWRLDSRRSFQQHRAFWSELLNWLASSTRPRVEIPLQGQRVSTEDLADLDISVRGSDFLPEREARVEAIVQGPDGERHTLLLQANTREPGRYTARIQPSAAGEYRIEYRIEFSDGEVLTPEAFFAASPGGAEYTDTRLREDSLRDLARITGGRYFDWTEAKDLREVPLSGSVPQVERPIDLTKTWPFFLFLAAIFCLEWWLRRRVGLK